MSAAARAAVAQNAAKQRAEQMKAGCASLAPSPLKRSYFSANFVATPPNAIYSIYVVDGVKLCDWPIEEMHEFLGTQRQWGSWLIRDDKLCRQVVAVFWTAYDHAMDKSQGEGSDPMALMPYAGEHRPLTLVAGSNDWIAPHLMDQLVGILIEYGYVPERQAKVLNALIDPFKYRRLAMHVGLVVLLNVVMWIMYGLDMIDEQIQAGRPAEEEEEGADANGTEEDDGGDTNSTNTTLEDEEDAPPYNAFPLKQHGVRPRTTAGLEGIPAMPFLHADINHILTNSVGFLLFGVLIVVKHGIAIYCTLSFWLWGWTGFFVWMIGREGVHIGASGIVYGYFGYILSIGILKLLGCPPQCTACQCSWDSVQDLVISAVIIGLYSGMLWGVLTPPEDQLVSWEGHLMGFAGGVIYAAGLAIYLRNTDTFKRKAGPQVGGPRGPTLTRRPGAGSGAAAAAGGATEMNSHGVPPFSAGASGPPDANPFASNGGGPSQASGGFETHFPPPSGDPPPPPPAASETSYV